MKGDYPVILFCNINVLLTKAGTVKYVFLKKSK